MKKEFTLSEQDILKFQKQGYIKLKEVATESQIKEFRSIMNEVVQKVINMQDNQQRIDDYSKILTQVTNVWKIDPKSHSFILNKKFGEIAKQLLQVEKVRLYHDQALVKPAQAGKTQWHQDYFYWPMDSQNTVTMWIPMHKCPRQMGTMIFAKGSHRAQNIQKMPISEKSQAYFSEKIKQNGIETETYDLQLGDATFHYGKTLHCAHGNQTGQQREIMTIIYMQDGVKCVPEEQMNEFRQTDLKVFCPGVKCREQINSELNPLIC